MTSLKKRTSIILTAFIFTLSIFLTLTLILENFGSVRPANAETGKSYAYYYNNLTTVEANGDEVDYSLAKEFYHALENIEESGDFKKGQVSYELDTILTSDKIKGWVIDGDLEIPKAFSAARDSFLMDHPELFYVDLYKLTISASRTNGVYTAFIDSGRAANVYRDNSFSTEEEVNNAIAKYNAALQKLHDDIVEAANEKGSDTKWDLALAIAANEALANNVAYDFGALNDYIEGSNVSTVSMTHTAYGAIVLNKAVCSGFAFAYKAVLDTFDIPCVVVSGYSKGKDSNGNDTENNVGHSWNYVYLQTEGKEDTGAAQAASASDAETQGAWFAFDTTWNSVSSNKNKYSTMEAFTASKKHIASGVISSSNYTLKYPALSAHTYDMANRKDYIQTEVKLGGFEFFSVPTKGSDGVYDYEYPKQYVSYNGYNAKQLIDNEQLHLAFRQYHMNNGELVWSKWHDMADNYEGSGVFHDNAETWSYTSSDVRYTQYAVVSVAPDDVIDFYGQIYKCYYKSGTVENNAVFMSAEIENFAYGTYTPQPYLSIEQTKPYMGLDVTISDSMCESSDSTKMSDKNAITLTLVYDEPLRILDPTKPIGVNFTGARENTRLYAGFTPFDDGKYVHLLNNANGVANILQIKFKPSLMYEHDRIGYIFTFENIGSAKIVDKKDDNGKLHRTTSDKAPDYAYFVFSRMYMACPQVFGDGRLWVECCAQPTLIDNSDLSEMDFKDAEGNSTFSEEERSQMMLVVNNVSSDTENDIIDKIGSDKSNNVSKKDIKSSQTYDISLSICGKVASIPDGSYVKLALGFPEGYGPDDEGVTFKIFHRKHVSGNNYIIEEIPCVVTKFGIVVTCKSFSPYTVVVVPENKATEKSVIATIDGKGGKLTKDDGQIQTVKRGGSYTYNIAPDDGYALYSVTLNGTDVKDRIVEGKLTLNYDELTRNNELEIKFISNEAAVRYEEKNIVEPVKVVMSTNNTSSKYSFVAGEVFENPTAPLSTGEIIGIVIGVVAVVGIAVAVTLIVIKKKKVAAKK